jgi:ureidoacrylate peracid hydrolase
MKANKTALVLIEFQNDFTTEGGALHGAVKTVMEKSGMLKNTVETINIARKAGVVIVHAPINFVKGYYEITDHPYGILKGVVDTNAFIKDSWGGKIVNELEPKPGDIVVEGKRGLDTFASTNLDFILRSKGIENLVLGGFLTNCCVESTMRTGYEKGYNVFTLTDCTAATSQEEQDASIKYTYPMFSKPMTHNAFLEMLQDVNVVA